jgi:hypothetical protein
METQSTGVGLEEGFYLSFRWKSGENTPLAMYVHSVHTTLSSLSFIQTVY